MNVRLKIIVVSRCLSKSVDWPELSQMKSDYGSISTAFVHKSVNSVNSGKIIAVRLNWRWSVDQSIRLVYSIGYFVGFEVVCKVLAVVICRSLFKLVNKLGYQSQSLKIGE